MIIKGNLEDAVLIEYEPSLGDLRIMKTVTDPPK
jgi:hypothetical protein